MNLSTWPADNTDRAVRTLDNMSEKLKSHAMPLTRYTLLHREARLTEKQRVEMTDWLTSTAAKLNQPRSNPPALPPMQIDSSAGRVLFLKNCAHCHGADGHGDDGPDLHNLDESNEWIANRIRTGKKGQMTAFAGKLSPADIDSLAAYVHTLK
jgi:mono/diheme cytochrome c family protein